jgi:hypothetical protein
MLALGQSNVVPQGPKETPPQQLYAAIPKDQQQGLQRALETLLALEKSGNWGEVYTWLFSDQDGGRVQTKEEFLSKMQHMRSVVFVPKQIVYIPPIGHWFVTGCVIYSPPLRQFKQNTGGFFAGFGAIHNAQGWQFEAPPGILPSKDFAGGTGNCNN